tara:strand:+ start:261 stop:671 length:411 start_codon:yes stop_codon:yes gene_type:complete
MNKMDLMTKIEGLEKAIKEHKDFASTYESQLTTTKQELEDYNKPEITPLMMDNIYEAIENVLNSYNFDNVDNYQDLEYELDYDGRVTLSSISFDTYDIQDKIVEKVCSLFKEAPSNEEGEVDNSQVNTQTVAEKIV